MIRVLRRACVIALVAVGLGGCGGGADVVPVTTHGSAPDAITVGGSSGTGPVVVTAPGPPTRPTVAPARVNGDVRDALTALTRFSTTLRAVHDATGFRARLTTLRGHLRDFDGAVRRLRGYRVADAALDARRARLAVQGPRLARIMSAFLDAVRDGDTVTARRLARDIQRRFDEVRRVI